MKTKATNINISVDFHSNICEECEMEFIVIAIISEEMWAEQDVSICPYCGAKK